MGRTKEFHNLAEARSWALHCEVATQLLDKPDLILRARHRVDLWMKEPAEHPYAAAWYDLLHQPVEKLRQALIDKREPMVTLRQASPFAGALDAATRWRILKRPELCTRETS